MTPISDEQYAAARTRWMQLQEQYWSGPELDDAQADAHFAAERAELEVIVAGMGPRLQSALADAAPAGLIELHAVLELETGRGGFPLPVQLIVDDRQGRRTLREDQISGPLAEAALRILALAPVRAWRWALLGEGQRSASVEGRLSSWVIRISPDGVSVIRRLGLAQMLCADQDGEP